MSMLLVVAMRRLSGLMPLLAVAGALPLACSFQSATEAEIRMDGGIAVDVNKKDTCLLSWTWADRRARPAC